VDMTSINCADGVFKIRPKFGIVADLGWMGSSMDG